MLEMVLAATLAVQGAAPPATFESSPAPITPTAVPAPPAPPPIVRLSSARSSFGGASAGEISSIEVRLSAESGLLWDGVLRVGGGQAATIMESRTEAEPASCPETRLRGRGVETSLRLSLSANGRTSGIDAYNVSVHWTRPGSAAECSDSGSRSVQLQQVVDLAAGREIVLRGDGGLVLRLRRR